MIMKWSEKKKMKVLIIVISILVISFWAVAFSNPNKWFKWNEWKEHIKEYHQK